jgi:hypothetical protein
MQFWDERMADNNHPRSKIGYSVDMLAMTTLLVIHC